MSSSTMTHTTMSVTIISLTLRTSWSPSCFQQGPWSSSKHDPHHHVRTIISLTLRASWSPSCFQHYHGPPPNMTHTTMSVLSFPWHYGHPGHHHVGPALPWSSSKHDPHHHVRTIISLHYRHPGHHHVSSTTMSSSTMTHTTMSVLSFPYITDMAVSPSCFQHYHVLHHHYPHHHVRTIISLHYHILHHHVSSTTMSSSTMTQTTISVLSFPWHYGHPGHHHVSSTTMVLLQTWPTPPCPYYHFPDITDILVTIMFPALPWSSSKHDPHNHVRTIISLTLRASWSPSCWSSTTMVLLQTWPTPPCPYYHFPDITDILVTIMFPALPWSSSKHDPHHHVRTIISLHYGHPGHHHVGGAHTMSSTTITHTTMSVLSFPWHYGHRGHHHVSSTTMVLLQTWPTPPCPYYHFLDITDILVTIMFPALPWSSWTTIMVKDVVM